MSDKPKPPCWVIPTDLIPFYGARRLTMGPNAIDMLKALENYGSWEPRTQALEDDVSFRQVIPYVIVTNTKTNKFMILERTKAQEEARLHGDVCIGAGGHLEQIDVVAGQSVIEAGTRRELLEEIGFTDGILQFIGILCVTDPAQPKVHHVHIGAVYHLMTEREHFGGEIEKQKPQWMTRQEVADLYPRMETWAKIVTADYLGINA
jgi:predicted NUDIX family phosphoesterase